MINDSFPPSKSNHTGGGVAWDLLLPRFCLRLQRKRLSEEDDGGGLKKKEDSDAEVHQRPFLSPGIKRSLVLSYVYMVDYVNLVRRTYIPYSADGGDSDLPANKEKSI